MEEVYRERLLQLRRVVLAAPDNELFDMSSVTSIRECGTSHCAYGWAKSDPWFLANTDIDSWMFGGSYSKSPGVFGLSREDVDALFDPPDGLPLVGSEAKRLVVANIDRILAGQPAIPYPDQE